MSYPYNNKKDISLSAESVLAFLTANPDFFLQNETLLKQLNIPHNLGFNVHSLVERQIALLREENTELKQTIKHTNELNKSSRHLRQHIYQFSLSLLSSDSITEIYRLLSLSMCKWFMAHEVKLYLFDARFNAEHIGGVQFMPDNSKLRFMFSELFNFNKPLCDSLQTEHLDALFKKETDKIRSTVLIPMKQSDWCGLFALCSREVDQYSHGEELDILVFISQIISFKIQELMNQS